MFKTDREMTEKVKRIVKFLRSMRKSVAKEGKKCKFVGAIFCFGVPLSQEEYNKIEKMCQKKKITISIVDENSDIGISGVGNYWFKLKV